MVYVGTRIPSTTTTLVVVGVCLCLCATCPVMAGSSPTARRGPRTTATPPDATPPATGDTPTPPPSSSSALAVQSKSPTEWQDYLNGLVTQMRDSATDIAIWHADTTQDWSAWFKGFWAPYKVVIVVVVVLGMVAFAIKASQS